MSLVMAFLSPAKEWTWELLEYDNLLNRDITIMCWYTHYAMPQSSISKISVELPVMPGCENLP